MMTADDRRSKRAFSYLIKMARKKDALISVEYGEKKIAATLTATPEAPAKDMNDWAAHIGKEIHNLRR